MENHAAAVALYFMFYNSGRVHQTLPVTRAMEAGMVNHVWSVEEIVGLSEYANMRGMRRVLCVALATALLCGWAAAASVLACTCESGFAFAAYAASDEIFTGRILTVTRDPTSEFQRLIVRVRVTESIKGTAAGQVEVISGSICGFPFEQGRDYLIYATYETDGLNVHLCNRTRTLDLASVDLLYIAGVTEGRAGATVYGWADRERVSGQPAIRELIRMRMVLSGTGGRFETVLEHGTFEFHFVPPGTYTLSAIGADVVKIMASRSGGVVLHRVTIHQSTDAVSLAVTWRIKGNDTPDSNSSEMRTASEAQGAGAVGALCHSRG